MLTGPTSFHASTLQSDWPPLRRAWTVVAFLTLAYALAILDRVSKVKASRIVIDSMSELRMLARDPLRYRRQIMTLKQFFMGLKTTVLLLDDRSGESSDTQLQSIAHGVLRMETLERERPMRLLLSHGEPLVGPDVTERLISLVRARV